MTPTFRAVRPITDFIDPIETPLAEFFEIGQLRPLDDILVANAWSDLTPDGFVLGAEFLLMGMTGLHLPGLDQLKLSFNPDAFAKGVMTCGSEASLELEDAEVVLEINAAILRARDGSGAKLCSTCGLRLDRDGFHFSAFREASLQNALIAGTDIEISLNGISLGDSPEAFLKVREGTLSLPHFRNAADAPLTLTGSGIVFGRDGLSGTFGKAEGPPLEVKVYGFSCRIDRAEITLLHGQFVSVDLGGQLDLGAFLAAGRSDGWISVDFSIGPSGIVAALSDDEAIVEMDIENLLALSVDTIRLEDGTLWLSGKLTPRIPGVDGGWPTLPFDEIGISPSGNIRLAKGASLEATQPFVLRWKGYRLTGTAFRIEHPKDSPDDLELQILATVEIVNGINVGASVEGLVARWRRTDGTIDVRFSGIGLRFGTPGVYDASVSIAWREGGGFTGSGHLDVSAMDMRLEVTFDSSTHPGNDPFNSCLVTVHSDLLPGGIPIGSSGTSLYAVSGLLAVNKELNPSPLSVPARQYFELFKAPPIGYASTSKWRAKKGASAIGLGVVIGTADDGWLFNCRGTLLISFEDLTLLVTAYGELLEKRPGMEPTNDGKLAAVLAIHPAIRLARLDYEYEWKKPPLFEVESNGGGEFDLDHPDRFSIWLGKAPEIGIPVSARALQVGGNWLLNAQYWLDLDAARQARAGLQARIELHAGLSFLYAELIADARAEARLSWKPGQFEGTLTLNGRARLSAGGLSLCQTLSVCAQFMIEKPQRVEFALKACREINLIVRKYQLCLHHTFGWRKEEAPQLEQPVIGMSAVPRHWNPRGPTGTRPVDDGIVNHVSDGGTITIDLGTIQPHSTLVIEFSKSLKVGFAAAPMLQLNDVATPLPEVIGGQSKWFAEWSLTRLELKDRTTAQLVSLFGTFSRSPLAREQGGNTVTPRPPNTELRLLSSRRFGQDGALGGGGAEQSPTVDCTQKETEVEKCTSLAGLEFGAGRLGNGWLYNWRTYFTLESQRDNSYGVKLDGEDVFEIYPPEGVTSITLTIASLAPDQRPDPATRQSFIEAVTYPDPVSFSTRDVILEKICWQELVGVNASGASEQRRGSSGVEEWTVAPEARLLTPGHQYELTIETSGQLKNYHSSVGSPLVTKREYVFTAGRAPDWEKALVPIIAGTYPSDGLRPVFLHYDLLVQFHDSYLETLYRLDRRALGVQLRDSNGKLVTSTNGRTLLPTQWEEGPITRPPIERWWGAARAGQPCESAPPPPEKGPTLLPITLKDLSLLPEMRYSAELVAVDLNSLGANPTEPLASWSFTTSRFATFVELATPPARVPDYGVFGINIPQGDDFTALVRAFGIPAVAVVSETRMTPVRVGEALAFVLIEAPEPLDDANERLKVLVAGRPATIVANSDRTRLIAELESSEPLTGPWQTIEVTLTWTADTGSQPTARRSVGGVASNATIVWQVPMRGLF